MAQRPSHIPKFGNWDPNDHMPYTVVFDNARAGKGGKIINPNDPMENDALYGKGGKIINPNDPMENDALYGKGSDVGSLNSGTSVESITRPATRHQRRASRDDSEFGFGNPGYNSQHGRNSSRGEEDSFSQADNGSNHDRTSIGSGVSPMHPQAYGGRLGRKPGSASPALDRKSDGGAPGTPSRNRPERYAAPLPKFGDWDVNNPSAGEGFTVIFDKARDEKKTGGALRIQDSPLRPEAEATKAQSARHESSNWFCRCFQPSTAY